LTFEVFVNGERFTLLSDRTMVGELITLGGGVPGQYELEERDGAKGRVVETFTDPNKELTVKNGEHFTTKYTETINPS
jgi:hypothetical protein